MIKTIHQTSRPWNYNAFIHAFSFHLLIRTFIIHQPSRPWKQAHHRHCHRFSSFQHRWLQEFRLQRRAGRLQPSLQMRQLWRMLLRERRVHQRVWVRSAQRFLKQKGRITDGFQRTTDLKKQNGSITMKEVASNKTDLFKNNNIAKNVEGKEREKELPAI
jgi:hypothetical protein